VPLVAVNVHVDGRVGTIELDRPERRNALDVDTCERIVAACAALREQQVRAVVVTGAGTSFCAGADFGEVYGEGFRDALTAALQAVHTLPVPTVAAVNGPAIGGGTQLAVACDLRVATETAVFAIPTARLGLAVDPWTIRRVAQLAGGGTARSLLLACEQLGAAHAFGRGLVDRIGDRAVAHGLAAELATLAPLTLAYNTLVLNRTPPVPDEPELLAAFEGVWASSDREEGRAARTAKRVPEYQGR
jgi:enoyl-CoA hydratase